MEQIFWLRRELLFQKMKLYAKNSRTQIFEQFFEIEPVPPQETWKSRFLAPCKTQAGHPRVKKFFSSSFSWIYTNQNFFTFRHKTEKKFLYFFVGFHESELFMTFKQKGTKNFFPYEVVSLCYIWQYQFIMLHKKSSQTVSFKSFLKF